LAIGIEADAAGIGIPTPAFKFCTGAFQFWSSFSIGFFCSGTFLTGCRTVWHFI
jgi:hypothetical protein